MSHYIVSVILGIVEGIITALIINYFWKNEPGLIHAFRKGGENETR